MDGHKWPERFTSQCRLFQGVQDRLGRYVLRHGMQDYSVTLGSNRLVLDCTSREKAFVYRRYHVGDNGSGSEELKAESIIMTDEEEAVVGVFPIPPFQTPKAVARNVYLKFKSHIVLDQKSEAVLYSKVPVEIGVFRQSKDEELLLDAFSIGIQQYALYGPPETGVVCRFKESEVSPVESQIEAKKYEEAIVRIRIANMIDNVVKVSKVIIPMEGIIIDHAHDDAWVPGTVDMTLDAAFGKDVVNVRLLGTKAKRADKTSRLQKEETITFYMDAGY